ncbi:acetyltransferase [Paracoccus sp. M683]|uniref:GNAT family N-acetyltransferase n=1 Tax=Paracoccus sp. M683 TaxID=2594268 RepID=UPI00117F5868|nr:GNAT family N-acetyltransferase [Paracoccus sp. M683]TRW97486.1 acetyltransferase [Paracoccus sp. M683]
MAEYGFRALTPDDLPMLADWLRAPEISRWWPDPAHQIAGIEKDLGEPAMSQLMVVATGWPIAFVQHYQAHRWKAPHFASLPAGTVAIDVFSAPDAMGQGGAWLDALALHLLKTAPMLAVDPAPDNTRAIRAYEKAGFRGDLVAPNEHGEMLRLMTRRRTD